jgi:LPXTG-site transpeptidase (sortase) family protein
MNAPATKQLRWFNHGLTVVVALLGVYIAFSPFAPQVTWWLRHDSPVQAIVPGKRTVVDPVTAPAEPPVMGDRLIIPSLAMQETIHTGKSISELRKGVWRVPHSSTPDKGGNTVLVGHRFTYSGHAVFYYLDKVKQGDHISITWQGKRYNYEVKTIKVVPPSDVSVEANTTEPLLTIYTCTPLLTAKNRLVIQATPLGAAQ